MNKLDSKTLSMRKHMVSMLFLKGFSLVISLLYVPMMLSAVTKLEYGVLLTLTSIVQWVSMLDIGLGNGLRNRLVGYCTNGDMKSARTAVSSCYAALALYIAVFMAIFLLVARLIDWNSILNAGSLDSTKLLKLVIIVFSAFSIQFVLNLVNSVLYAFQLPAQTSLIVLFTQVLSYLSIWLLSTVFNVHSFLVIGAATSFAPIVVLLFASIIFYNTRLKQVKPSIRQIDFKSVNSILGLGLKFFALQIITIIIFQANNLIISHVAGPEFVVEYNIVYKYIGILSMAFVILVTPVWSAVTEAYVQGNFDWIEKTVKSLQKILVITFILGIIMVCFSPFIYKIWVGEESSSIHMLTTILVFAFIFFEMAYRLYGSIINGMGKLNAQLLFTSIIAVTYVPLAVLLGKKFGLAGVMSANILVQALNLAWSKIQYNKIISGKAKGIWNR